MNSEILAKAKKLRVIATNTTGLDHIDVEHVKDLGIQLISLKENKEFLRSIHATAELTWGLLLAAMRHLPQAIDAVKNKEWKRENFIGRELAAKHIGIIGVGRIGEKIARYAEAFSMHVHGFDSDVAARKIKYVNWHDELDSMLSICDILTIHVPLNAQTEKYINTSFLERLKPGAVLINTSRGAVLDEQAVVQALINRHLACVAVDVLANEHHAAFPECNTLWQFAQQSPRVIISPHIGGAAWEAWDKTERFIARQVITHLNKD
ncbi:NAD(P)-dependent oxidoreductase [Legionella septentrionalis]|uniref:NAD(P)-dependent oxidoreductase n=1 Tax=Legionella septentrionalis TaxID=2498109 RepID=UPI0013158413|nr:NAD(P)-dependent oxidoreductase [Legionella septentrionalis]